MINESALQRATPFGHRHDDGGVVQAHMLQPLPQSGPGLKNGPPVFTWDFSKIPLFPPVQTGGFQPPPGFSAPRLRIQAKLKVGAVNDPLEQEADRVADQVMRMPAPGVAPTSAPAQVSRKCAGCEEEEKLQKKEAGPQSATSEAPGSVHEVLRSPGQPLDASSRAYFEQRFGQDIMKVRVHSGAAAEQSARDMDAHAYTVGHDIVFGAGQFAPGTIEGRRLIAHELAHVVQQSSAGHSLAAQRQETFTGGPGKTALDKDRPLNVSQGPIAFDVHSGGTPIPKTAGTGQNCAGDSCSIKKWINWPFLGFEVPNLKLQGDWTQATNFVPAGCTRVNCSGVDVWRTRCKSGELELIVFLYKWPVTVTVNGTPMAGTQSDFHMIGREAGSLEGWHSKADRREKVANIGDPLQSLYDAYPHTKQKDRTIVQLCFCCKQSAIKTA
ncbi:MAG: DUF4157 domain-containing protein [Methylocella sp.]